MALVGWKEDGTLTLSHRNMRARHAARKRKIALVGAHIYELFLQENERIQGASEAQFLPSNCVMPERQGDIFILRDNAPEICLQRR